MEIIGQYLKNTTGFGNVVSSHCSLMPFKVVYTKLMGIATADCEKNGFDGRAFSCSCFNVVYNLVNTYKCNNYLETAR